MRVSESRQGPRFLYASFYTLVGYRVANRRLSKTKETALCHYNYDIDDFVR